MPWPVAAGGNGHAYQAVATPDGISWDDANAWASAHGGYLAPIHSAAQNDFVFKLVDDPKFWKNGTSSGVTYCVGPWLGGVKAPGVTRANEGWQWAGGQNAMDYTNWADGQPDNDHGRGGENRVQFMGYGANNRQPTWNDTKGTLKEHGFVVEYPDGFPSAARDVRSNATSRPAPPPSANAPLVAGPVVTWAVAVGGNGHAYQAVAAPGGINWADANAWGVTHGGYLATIATAAENDFVFNLVDDPKFWRTAMTTVGTECHDGPWLGGFKSPDAPDLRSGWQWINGDGRFDYTRWAGKQPDNHGGNEDRLNFFSWESPDRAATWNDEAGGALEHGFVVEYNFGRTD